MSFLESERFEELGFGGITVSTLDEEKYWFWVDWFAGIGDVE